MTVSTECPRCSMGDLDFLIMLEKKKVWFAKTQLLDSNWCHLYIQGEESFSLIKLNEALKKVYAEGRKKYSDCTPITFITWMNTTWFYVESELDSDNNFGSFSE